MGFDSLVNKQLTKHLDTFQTMLIAMLMKKKQVLIHKDQQQNKKVLVSAHLLQSLA